MQVVATETLVEQYADLSADWEGEWRYCKGMKVYEAQAAWDADAGTAGELFLEGSNGNTSDADQVVRFDNADMDWWVGTTTVAVGTPTIGAAAGKALLVVQNPMLYHRIVYVGAGGIANQLVLLEFMRGV